MPAPNGRKIDLRPLFIQPAKALCKLAFKGCRNLACFRLPAFRAKLPASPLLETLQAFAPQIGQKVGFSIMRQGKGRILFNGTDCPMQGKFQTVLALIQRDQPASDARGKRATLCPV